MEGEPEAGPQEARTWPIPAPVRTFEGILGLFGYFLDIGAVMDDLNRQCCSPAEPCGRLSESTQCSPRPSHHNQHVQTS